MLRGGETSWVLHAIRYGVSQSNRELGNLHVRQTLEVSQHERGALMRRERAEALAQVRGDALRDREAERRRPRIERC
jgi:hypothetical protein